MTSHRLHRRVLLSPSERQRRYEEALATAAMEADQFGEAERLHQQGRTWAEAQAAVGLAMPHSTFRRRQLKWRQSGAAGLVDHRHPPPSRVTDEIRGFILGLGHATPLLSTESILEMVWTDFKVRLAIRTIQEVLQFAGLARPKMQSEQRASREGGVSALPEPAPVAGPMSASSDTPQTSQTPPVDDGGVKEELPGAGLVWLAVASEKTGYAQEMAQVIKETAQALPEPPIPIGVDRENRDEKGRFLPEYNAPRPRFDPQVGAVFESLDFKEMDKDLRRLSIVETSCETIEKKVLALTALPVVSERGRFDGVADPRGEWLRSLCGHDYKPETLARFARELKYARVSTPLMDRHAQLWHRELSPALGEDVCALIVYADGTVKPLWTNLFSRSGKVAMLGRVMPCLETISIHTGSGVPLYLKTFSGGASLVTNLLPTIHEMEAAIGQGMVGRLTVIDAGGASVAFFKELDHEHRLFVTPLSRIRDLSEVKDLTPFVAYRDGDSVAGGWVYLRDSNDNDRKAPLYKLRAVVLKRRTKETFTVYGSSAPVGDFSDTQLMDAYFRRWPAQEIVFRNLNGGVNFKTVHGYGRQRVLNVTVIDEITKLSAQIENSVRRLEQAKQERDESARSLQELEATKQQLRAPAKPGDETAGRQQGTRSRASGKDKKPKLAPIDKVMRENNRLKVQLARARHKERETKVQRLEAQIERKEQEKAQLEDRREIYQHDVELDQILSVFKLGCALLVQVTLYLFFGGRAIEFNTFANRVLALPGTRVVTDSTETIRFRANRRDPEMMDLLEQACHRFNATNHQRNGRSLRFEVAWPSAKSRHVSRHAT